MAYNIALFLHIAGVATWFGAMHILAIWLGRTAKAAEGKALADTLQTVHRLNLRTLVPSAVIVLASGLYMLSQHYMNGADIPFWLLFKERFGSLFILAYIIGFTLYSRKLKGAVSGSTEQLQQTAKRYTMLAHVTTLLILVVILFATLKFN